MRRHSIVPLAIAAFAICLVAAPQCSAFPFQFEGEACPDKEVVQNFDLNKYLGEWYQVERMFNFFDLNVKCAKTNYTLDTSTGQVLVRSSMIDKVTSNEKIIEGTAEQVDSPKAKLNMTLHNLPVLGTHTAPYWVLDTDYTNYSVVYSCSNSIIRLESAWVLSRAPSLADTARQNIDAAIEKAGIPKDTFTNTEQDCN